MAGAGAVVSKSFAGLDNFITNFKSLSLVLVLVLAKKYQLVEVVTWWSNHLVAGASS